MDGVDVADQYNTARVLSHRVRSYVWRRVFEANIPQSDELLVGVQMLGQALRLGQIPRGQGGWAKMKRDGYSHRGIVGEVALRAKSSAKVGTLRALKRPKTVGAISFHPVSKK